MPAVAVSKPKYVEKVITDFAELLDNHPDKTKLSVVEPDADLEFQKFLAREERKFDRMMDRIITKLAGANDN